MALVELGRRRPFSRVAFNSGVYVLAGIAAGGAAAGLRNGSLLGLALGSVAAAVAFYLVNITLLAAVVTRSRGIAFPPAVRSYVQLTFVPFAVMASLAVILVVLWDRSPFVAVVLVGPVVATALYQCFQGTCMRRCATDPTCGTGNICKDGLCAAAECKIR